MNNIETKDNVKRSITGHISHHIKSELINKINTEINIYNTLHVRHNIMFLNTEDIMRRIDMITRRNIIGL